MFVIEKRSQYSVIFACRSGTFLIWLTMFTIGIVLSIIIGFFLFAFCHVDVPRIIDWQFTFMCVVTKQQICAIISITFASSNVQNGTLIALLILWFIDFPLTIMKLVRLHFFFFSLMCLDSFFFFASQDSIRWLQYNSRLYSLLCQLTFFFYYINW